MWLLTNGSICCSVKILLFAEFVCEGVAGDMNILLVAGQF